MENKKYKISRKKLRGSIADAFAGLRNDIINAAGSVNEGYLLFNVEETRERCIDGATKLVQSKEYDAFESGIAFTLATLTYYTDYGKLPKTNALVGQAVHLVTSAKFGVPPQDMEKFIDVMSGMKDEIEKGIKKAIEDGAE